MANLRTKLDMASGWLIKGLEGTTNPTLLNNVNITGQTIAIKEKDTLKVGNFEIQLIFKEVEIFRRS